MDVIITKKQANISLNSMLNKRKKHLYKIDASEKLGANPLLNLPKSQMARFAHKRLLSHWVIQAILLEYQFLFDF